VGRGGRLVVSVVQRPERHGRQRHSRIRQLRPGRVHKQLRCPGKGAQLGDGGGADPARPPQINKLRAPARQEHYQREDVRLGQPRVTQVNLQVGISRRATG